MKKWVLLDDSEISDSNTILKILLKNRGITSKTDMKNFLDPKLDYALESLQGLDINDMKKASVRIRKAIKNKESVVVYTDYDVDGICAGAQIWETLFKLGASVMPYIPDRKTEGYGMTVKGIDLIIKKYHPGLIITVDHGISCHGEVSYAKKSGIDTIIIDHHLLPEVLPDSFATIHTTNLAAGGIAWIFSNYLLSETSENTAASGLELAALATVADMVPLKGFNRSLVKFGLNSINNTNRIGLDALINISSLEKGKIGVYEIGHILAPRINAMGRIDNALDALRLICTNDQEKAMALARKLNDVNHERQVMMKDSSDLAHGLIKIEKMPKILIIEHESFNEGIIGLVAGKLVEEFSRPVIVISKKDGCSKASARSIKGFNIFDTICMAKEFLTSVGGHPMAAGFTIDTSKIKLFKSKLEQIADKLVGTEILEKEIRIDLDLNIDFVGEDILNTIEKLAPYGIGNPQPVFLSRKLKVKGIKKIGKNKNHIKLFLTKDNQQTDSYTALGFNMSEVFPKIIPGNMLDIVYTVETNDWKVKNGMSDKNELQLILKDVKIYPG